MSQIIQKRYITFRIIIMSLLVSTTKGLRVVEIDKQIKVGGAICVGDANITQLQKFKLKGRDCLAVVRDDGFVQVYEYSKQQYKLAKEWRNCKISKADSIIEIGLIEERYLYSCSVEGKFIVRDMINDDDDNSNRLYRLASPISAIKIRKLGHMLEVAIGGKDTGLKLYEIDMNLDYYYQEFTDDTKLFNITTSSLNSLNQLRQILRKHNESLVKEKLVPVWGNGLTNYGLDWAVSIEFFEDLILCGNQFGYITTVDKQTGECQVLTKPSSFPVTNLRIIHHYLIYNDLISQIGIIDLHTNRQIHQFDYKFGPIESSQLLIRKKHKYFPLVFLVTTSEGELIILNLFRDNTVRLAYKLKFDAIIHTVHILNWKHSMPLRFPTKTQSGRAFTKMTQLKAGTGV